MNYKATKNYNHGIHTGFGCTVDEDMHGGPNGSILVAWYECETLRDAVETAVALLQDNYEVTIFSGGRYNPRSYLSVSSIAEDYPEFKLTIA